MTKQKHTKAIDAASNAEELLPLEQMMSQGSASSEGAVHAVDATTQVKYSVHRGAEGAVSAFVPKLRFAGFTEPWKTEIFEQVFGFLPKVNIARDQLSVSSGSVKNIHYGDILTVFGDVLDVELEAIPRITGSSLLPKHDPFLLQNGDVVIADTAEDSSAGKAIELTGINDKEQVIGGQHTMPCRPYVKFSPYFLGYLLNSSCFRDALINQLQGIKVLSISKANLGALPVRFPVSSIEQQHIGALFKELDHNIELNRGLLEKLTQLKKSMLEQMFPREGESVPRLRFAGFTEPWTVCKLGDLGQAISGIAFPESAQGGVEGMPFFKVSDMNLEGNESVMHYANNYVSYELVAKSKWKPIEGPAVIFVRDGAAVLLNRKRLILSKCLMDHHIMHYCLDESVWNPFFALAIFEGIDLTALVRTSVTPSYGAAEVEAIVVRKLATINCPKI